MNAGKNKSHFEKPKMIITKRLITILLNPMMKSFLLATFLVSGAEVKAQLVASVSPVQVVGQKAVVQLKMKNNLADKIESARAVCFILNDQGKMIGQSTKWVIGQNKTELKPKAETTFYFVVNNLGPSIGTNLTVNILFNSIILGSGPVADVRHEVVISAAIN